MIHQTFNFVIRIVTDGDGGPLCEAAFADRKLGNLQLVLSRTGEPDATMARTTERATRSAR